ARARTSTCSGASKRPVKSSQSTTDCRSGLATETCGAGICGGPSALPHPANTNAAAAVATNGARNLRMNYPTGRGEAPKSTVDDFDSHTTYICQQTMTTRV